MRTRSGLYVFKSLAAGLLTSQMLFSLQIYAANHKLYERIKAMADAGYLVVPNEATAINLTGIDSAFYGALFFSLSVGAFLSLGALAGAWIWDRLGGRRRMVLNTLCLPWAACICAVNAKGFCPWITAVFLAAPAVTFGVAIRWMPAEGLDRRRLAAAVLPAAILAGMWLSQMDAHMMIDIRDGLLLSNSLGRNINDFYYRYTLYPAEVFKSMNQKLIKTVGFDAGVKPALQAEIEKRLVDFDYLKMRHPALCDLWIRQAGGLLVLEHDSKSVVQTPVQTFFSQTSRIIAEFSEKTDRWPFYRRFTLTSVLIGLPVLCYMGIYGTAAMIARTLKSRHASFWAAGVCLGAGVVLLAFFYASRPGDLDNDRIPDALGTSRPRNRVAALKTIARKNLEIADYPVYAGLLSSEHAVERYWLVKCLGVSRKPETLALIQNFLDDPQANVACMAFQALGRRGNSRSVEVIVSRIAGLRHGYVQWYAYRALRSLGWRPAILMQKSS